MKILGVIPARGGSKSIKNKNMSEINGKPLIYYTIKEALKSTFISDLVVSSDDESIINYSTKLGAVAPFKRPKNLSTDNALSASVVYHALEYMESLRSINYDLVIMLQPTSPFRKVKHIDESIKLIINKNSDSLVSVVNVDGYHPYRMKKFSKDYVLNYIDQGFEDMRPRQSLPKVFIRNGAIYIVKCEYFKKNKNLVGQKCLGYEMDLKESVNIDNEIDLLVSKTIMEKQDNV